MTFEIRKTTSDSGAADANNAIRYPMSSFVITDNKVEYQTVDAHGNKSGWLDGGAETVQTQHFVEGVTVGKMSFAQLEEAYGTAAEGDRIYADVYGLTGTQARMLFENVWIYTFGVGALCATRVCSFSQQQLGQMLTTQFQGMMMLIKSGNYPSNGQGD